MLRASDHQEVTPSQGHNHYQMMILGKLFTHTHGPLSPGSIIWYWSKGDDVVWLERLVRPGSK